LRPRLKKAFKVLFLLYAVALIASHLVRSGSSFQFPYLPDQSFVDVKEMKGTEELESQVSMAYLDLEAEDPTAPVLVILHGSPVASSSLMRTVNALKGKYHLIVPDLPGFGGSTRKVKDYSILAHAYYLEQLMIHLGIKEFHLAGYSMGGGVAIEYAHAFPAKLKSLILISSIGVQEQELLGDYTINHAIHGAQLAGLWFLQEAVPHFGWMDDAILAIPYARNFYDTDQRPLRGYLEALEIPTLILHAENDNLVPTEAALEHHRIIPQSELKLLEDGHMFIITRPDISVPPIVDFITRTEAGATVTRSEAEPERLRLAGEPFVFEMRPVEGISFGVLWLLLVVATFISEDLTCISAGLLVVKGVLGFIPATMACAIGIFIGDVLLYLAGRWLGSGFIRRAPLRWFVSEHEIIRSTHWFEKRGAILIFVTRFFPGTRLATYFTCGVLGVPFLKFTGYFILAAVVWTPLLVGLSTLLGGSMLAWFEVYQTYALPGLIGFVVVMLLLLKLVVPMFSHRGRRLLLGKWIRVTRWEFWPLWKFYPPVILYVLWLGLKHRNLSWFTATNPGMPMSGLVMESKKQILDSLKNAGLVIPAYELIPNSLSPDNQYAELESFLEKNALPYPVVLKPDVGERGMGVAIIQTDEQAKAYFEKSKDDVIVQAYMAGREYGIFYYRLPEESHGHVFAITDKRFVSVTGDGIRNFETLILDDARTVAMAPFFMRKYAERLFEIPEAGEEIRLSELGTHARGCLFLDGMHLLTPALETEIDRISKHFEGFFFGRYDVKVPSIEQLQKGENIRVLELNGITSEATSIYDPKNGLFTAYKVLFDQWGIASSIVFQNKSRGVKPATCLQVIKQYITYKNHEKVEI
jgi:pimeloyl-ACP methyl ester carboxylesterase/membrane protein DedA with SNARE-associated domain